MLAPLAHQALTRTRVARRNAPVVLQASSVPVPRPPRPKPTHAATALRARTRLPKRNFRAQRVPQANAAVVVLRDLETSISAVSIVSQVELDIPGAFGSPVALLTTSAR